MHGFFAGARSIPIVALAYGAVLFWIYAPALNGAFVSDDIGYVAGNPWIHELSLANLRAILDPTGPAAAHTANWAPLHLLLHAAAWQAFGADTFGHHVVNVALHAIASALLVALFVRYGAPLAAALVAGALFALHPANVEAVAWIFQLKSIVALALATAALLVEPRRPWIGLALFALALLAKIQAAFALPVALVAVWCAAPDGAREARTRLVALAGWAVALGLALLPGLLAFERLGHAEIGAPLAALDRVRASVAILGRYFEMALTSRGVAAFQQPDLPASWLDPYVLLGVAGGVAIATRALFMLAKRRPEAAFWAWVVGGLVPVSQLLPFLYPIADRYLYFVLPGLLGAALLALRTPLERLERAPRSAPAIAALVTAALVLGAFGARSHARAAIWKSDATLARDSAAKYPNGLPALLMRAQGAAVQRDVDGAVAALRAASARGFDRFVDLEKPDSIWSPLQGDPRFRAVVAEIAGVWIGHVADRENPTAPELRMWGMAHAARGEWDDAIAKLERALAIGGQGTAGLRADLAEVRARERRAARAAQRESDGTPAP
jgi:hypothetical protein